MGTGSRSRVIRLFGLCLLCALIPLQPAPRIHAAALVVTSTDDELNADGDCSLREAISASNTNAAVDSCAAGGSSDTLVLPAGTYRLALAGPNEDAAASGDFDVLGNLAIVGAGAAHTVVDAQALDRAFEVRAGATLALSGLTAQNGAVANSRGAGILSAGTLMLSDSVVANNRLTIDCDACPDGLGGAGIASSGALTLSGTRVVGNTVQHICQRCTLNFGAGGLETDGTATVTRSSVMGNSGYLGGGINNHGTLHLVDSTLAENTALVRGGGLASTGVTTILRSALIRNVVTSSGELTAGGGMYNEGVATVSASTISANRVTASVDYAYGRYSGAGLHNAGRSVLEFVTIAQNQIRGSEFCLRICTYYAGSGTGLFTATVGSTIMAYSIVADNATTVDRAGNHKADDCFGNVVGGPDLVRQPAGCIFDEPTQHVVNVDPKLGPVQDNGGPTPTQALLPGSRALDRFWCSGVDQRGSARPADGDGDGVVGCDFGAYELATPYPRVFVPLWSRVTR